jgi:UDP-xylose/UDP-N-acetylglucosamine transporter B4
MVAIESLTSSHTNTMHLMTFITFCVTSIEGLITSPDFIRQKHIPLRANVTIVLIYFFVSLINNQAPNFDIPFPLFIIFRSGTLFANVILTAILQRQVYPTTQIVSVIIVTLGIAFFLWDTQSATYNPSVASEFWADALPVPKIVTGVTLLTIGLFLSAYMGILQERLYRDYGPHHSEMMYSVHFLSLPLFAFVWQHIYSAAVKFSSADNITLGGVELPITTLWAKMAILCVLQLFCVRNVYKMTSVLTSINTTMVLTIRKFINLLLSVYIFNNHFTIFQFFASLMVFSGSFAFYDGFHYISKLRLSGITKKTV